MKDFIWLDDNYLVNPNAVAYVELKEDGASLAFSNGHKLTIEGEAFNAFKGYLDGVNRKRTLTKGGCTYGWQEGPRLR